MKPRQCREPDCVAPATKGALYCTDHLGQRRRCTGMVREVDPDDGAILAEHQCKRAARPGLDVCERHGGLKKANRALSTRASQLTAMQQFAAPYEGDVTPDDAARDELRRTYGRILWLEQQIALLASERDLIWGKTKEERTTASEFPGTTVTYEARINGFEEMLRWERRHLLDIIKVAITDKIATAEQQRTQAQIAYTWALVQQAAQALGHDVGDPNVVETLVALFERGITDATARKALPAATRAEQIR